MKKLLIIFFLCPLVVFSGNYSVNEKAIEIKDSTGNYSFVISGHFHGSSNNETGLPAATVLAAIDELNKHAFVLSTGDLFLDVKNDFKNYNRVFFSKLTIPLFNAVGNHDNEDGKNTWYSFINQSEFFIVLNTEINDGSIQGEQFDFLKSAFNAAKLNKQIKNVFILSHRPVWAEQNNQLKDLFKENTRSTFTNNFESDISPLIKEISAYKKVYWCSGSLGGDAPASFFYHSPQKNIFYIQSAIRNLKRDAILVVKVTNGQIEFETLSLTGQISPRLEDCDVQMWKRGPKSEFNYRLIPLYIKQTVLHRYFWYGALFMLFFVLMLRYILRKYKKRKIGQS